MKYEDFKANYPFGYDRANTDDVESIEFETLEEVKHFQLKANSRRREIWEDANGKTLDDLKREFGAVVHEVVKVPSARERRQKARRSYAKRCHPIMPESDYDYLKRTLRGFGGDGEEC